MNVPSWILFTISKTSPQPDPIQKSFAIYFVWSGVRFSVHTMDTYVCVYLTSRCFNTLHLNGWTLSARTFNCIVNDCCLINEMLWPNLSPQFIILPFANVYPIILSFGSIVIVIVSGFLFPFAHFEFICGKILKFVSLLLLLFFSVLLAILITPSDHHHH